MPRNPRPVRKDPIIEVTTQVQSSFAGAGSVTPCDDAPEALGVSADPGTSANYSRCDHVHPATGLGGSGLCGDGSDGVLHFDGSTTTASSVPSGSIYTLVRDVRATTITIDIGVTVNPAGYSLLANSSITNNGTISRKGNNGTSVTGPDSSKPGGAALSGGNLPGSRAGGSSGGGGAAGSAGGSPNPQQTLNGSGGAGGDGGDNGIGGTNLGGAGGAALNPGVSKITPRNFAILAVLAKNMEGSTGQIDPISNGAAGGGGGAGGESGDGAPGGGGSGGGGGGYIVLASPSIVNTGLITVQGGNGGAGGSATGPNAGGGGGGGGGAGGTIVLVYFSLSDSGSIVLSGGAGAAPGSGIGTGGSGTAGTSGDVGVRLDFQG